MADENDVTPAPVVAPTDAEIKTPTVKKPNAPRRQKTVAEPVRAGSKVAGVKSPSANQRKYSEQEKIEKLKLIETQINAGASTLKDAVKNVGISEQSYYNWKRIGTAVEQTGEKPVPGGDELADLIQLEEENRRLRKILAEKLRAENAELRKKLQLD